MISIPRLREFALCALCASACSAFLGGYFGAAWGGMAAFFCCLLLFVSAVMLRPAPRELLAGALLGVLIGTLMA